MPRHVGSYPGPPRRGVDPQEFIAASAQPSYLCIQFPGVSPIPPVGINDDKRGSLCGSRLPDCIEVTEAFTDAGAASPILSCRSNTLHCPTKGHVLQQLSNPVEARCKDVGVDAQVDALKLLYKNLA
jgi:hypothetical protein